MERWNSPATDIMQFADLGLSPDVLRAIADVGYTTPTPIQAQAIPVVLTGRDTRALEAVEERIYAAAGSATIAPVDLAEPDGIARLATAVAQRWERLDIMVINAAILPQLTSVADIDPRAFGQAMTTNVLATQALIASFDKLLRNAPGGRVVGLTSGVARNPRAYWGAYAASKAAFEVLLDCYAQETRNVSKLRVAIVNPSATRTAMRARAYPGEDPASVKPPEAVASRLVALLGEPFESGHRETVNQPG